MRGRGLYACVYIGRYTHVFTLESHAYITTALHVIIPHVIILVSSLHPLAYQLLHRRVPTLFPRYPEAIFYLTDTFRTESLASGRIANA